MIHNKDSQKVYRALMVLQEDTNAPEVTELQNSLDLDITWTRFSTGLYQGTASQQFPLGKTWLMVGQGYTLTTDKVLAIVSGPNIITVQTFRSGLASDDVINEVPIELRVYEQFT